jgi:hypothetical protein
MVAALILALDLFVGFATLGRIAAASNEDLRYLQGMNRLRHAYHEIVPGLEPYFITSKYDDFDSVAGFYGPPDSSALRGMIHGFTTMPGMIGVICCAVAGVLAGVLVLLATRDPMLAGLVAVIAFTIIFLVVVMVAYRAAMSLLHSMESKWPAPSSEPAGKREG